MKHLIIFVAIFICGTVSYPTTEELQSQWHNFKQLHQKTYNKQEELKRIEIFQNNLNKIEEHNKRYEKHEVSYQMAVNQFADMSHEEFLQYINGYKNITNYGNGAKPYQPVISEIPDEIDWREKGAVTEVKNQLACGSCWAFSVTGALEGQNFLKTGNLVSLSEQELVDCIIQRKVRGCNGGFVEYGYEYVMKHGLSSEADYPYEAEDDLCHRGNIPSAATENGYVLIVGNEEALKEAVGTIGPISVAVDASNWQFYSSGIFLDSVCSSDDDSLNHGVLAVGYGTDDGSDYWIVKNSWGPSWGENGYIRSARNANNNCGIATHPTYPIV